MSTYYQSQNVFDLIETLWNVKNLSGNVAMWKQIDLIETLWNVKVGKDGLKISDVKI